VTPGQRL